MIIGIDSMYKSEYGTLFKTQGKTYITSLLSELLSTNYNRKVLVINLDYNKEKNIFAESNIKIKTNTKSNINDFLDYFDFSIKSIYPVDFSIDNILNNVITVNKNLEILTVDCNKEDSKNMKFIEYANKMNRTHLTRGDNAKFFLYILNIIKKSNIWDYVLLDLSSYDNSELFTNELDGLIKIVSLETFIHIAFSKDKELINYFKDELNKNIGIFNTLVINNIPSKKYEIEEIFDYLGIDYRKLLGITYQEKLFTSNSKNIKHIVDKIEELSNS